jgi:NIMA (never in mitosis gene a)-related kinase
LLNSARLGTQDYDFGSIKIIKEGGQAIVFEIKSKIDGRTYVAKRLQYRIGAYINERRTIAAAEREISCLRALKHPMIMGMVDLIKDPENNPCIIMEKCNQSLANIINDYTQGFIPENRVLRIFSMICIALYFIHQKKMVHRDIKPDNIL